VSSPLVDRDTGKGTQRQFDRSRMARIPQTGTLAGGLDLAEYSRRWPSPRRGACESRVDCIAGATFQTEFYGRSRGNESPPLCLKLTRGLSQTIKHGAPARLD
jgi:hypothetical protein